MRPLREENDRLNQLRQAHPDYVFTINTGDSSDSDSEDDDDDGDVDESREEHNIMCTLSDGLDGMDTALCDVVNDIGPEDDNEEDVTVLSQDEMDAAITLAEMCLVEQ